jgi:transposase
VAARWLKRAQLLLAASSGSSDVAIVRNRSVGASTVYGTKRRFVEEDLEAAITEKTHPGADRKLAAKEKALLIATACAAPPCGRAR